ncbi:MAG: ABC transporter ATP-binding protein [Bacteroidales bacterium]|nr:ABC transporter ATP-binding protein [Bacteroidales bacterium]
MSIIDIENVSKHYAKTVAVDNVSLNIEKGEIFGIIGPDGAGKTTLFRMMTTLIVPDTGKINVNGSDSVKDYFRIRENIGYMPGKFSLYPDLSVEENINFFASIFGTTLKENYHLVETIYKQIEPFKKRKASALSGGMKQKLALCCSLIHAPEILFLDEPTTGVDPTSRKEFWNMLDQLKNIGLTIVASTPYMDEASRCDRIGLMRNGKFLGVDSVENIIKKYDKQLWGAKSNDMYKLLIDLRKHKDIESCFTFGAEHHFTTYKGTTLDIEELKKYLREKNHNNISVYPLKANIEDCYINLAHN